MRLALGLCCAALVACGKSGRTAPSPSTSAPPASVAAAASVVLSPNEPAIAPSPATCRALRVVGDAKLGNAPLASGAEVDGAEWLELGEGASLTLKHTSSGRELSVSGPALLRACRRGREQVLLARGTVRGGAGMGARPGGEVLIATPVAAIRYGEADFTLSLSEKKLVAEVRAGQLELDSASDEPLQSPLRAKAKLSVPLGKPDPVALMARCRAAAEDAATAARKVGEVSASEPLGQRASAHVNARRAARSTCNIAASAIGLVADPARSAGLWADAARWEALGETVVRPTRAKAAEK